MKYPAFITPEAELALYDKQGFQQDWYDHIGRNVLITLHPVSQITAAQHAGYRGVILPQVLDAIEEEGLVSFPEDYPRRKKLDVIHEHLLKKMFLATRFNNKLGMELIEMPSMADLSIQETQDFWEQISAWYAEMFHAELRMPKKII